MQPHERIQLINQYWFGRVEDTIVPSENRARIWFSEGADIDDEIKVKFRDDHTAAINGEYSDWSTSSRGRLALILILDQFSRHLYRNTEQAYAYDQAALDICVSGLQSQDDHNLSLIERVFYYFPLLHAEDLGMQKKSLECYQMLMDLAFSETRMIYKSFLKFSNHHYSIIESFGRFPQRNNCLGRESTQMELNYLEQVKEQDDNIQ